jgi:hypothetical protein
MMRLVSILLLLALAAAAGFSQARLWEELNGVAGFSTIQEGAGGTLFAIRGDAVVFSSTDRGLSWRGTTVLGGQTAGLFARGPNLIAARIDPRASNYYQFHLSRDNGVTWTRITTSNNTNRQLIGFSDLGSAYAYFRDTFFGNPSGPYFLLKYDGAGAWPNSGVPLPNLVSAASNRISTHLIDHAGNILVGSSRAGLFTTHDEGATWEQSFAARGITALSLTPGNKIYLAADPTIADGGVYVSSDGARTWSYLGFSEKRVSALAADSAGNLIASTADGFYRLGVGSEAWEYASPFSELFDVMLSTRDNTILASSGTWGQFRSNDGGNTWVQSGPRKRDVFSIVVTSSGTTIAGTLGARTFVSSDEGSNWLQAPDGAICDNVLALAERQGTVYAGTECGVYRSSDEGLSWTRTGSDAVGGPVPSFAIRPDGDVYAATLFGVARSGDAGLTWERRGLADQSVISVAVGPAGDLYAATAHAGIFRSADGGLEWTPLGAVREDLQSVHADASGTLFAGVFGGVVRSADGGLTWEERSFSEGYVAGIASLPGQSVYAAAPEGVFATSDDGLNWSALDATGLFYPHVLSLSFDGRGVLFAGTYSGGVYRTARTMTGVEGTSPAPAAFRLSQNYPNPFNPETMIEYSVPGERPTLVRLAVFDLLGREVAVLSRDVQTPGLHRVSWNAGALPAGVYFLRMQAGSYTDTRKMLFLR